MSLMSWNPLSELEVMRQQMDRVFSQMVANGRMLPLLEPSRMLLPHVDVFTSGKDVILTAELPGLEPKDVTVEVSDQSIHITGESRRQHEVNEENYVRSERQYGHFERIIPLPYRIKDQEAKAAFKHGVLTIRAPLAEELKLPKARKLTVES